MSREQVYCVLDYETYSEADLKKVGGYEYSMHSSTDIICAAWRIGTRETLRKAVTHWWAPDVDGGKGIGTLVQAFMDPDVMLVAHNALFEQVITRNVFATKHMYSERYSALRRIPPSRWICTASLASALALPRNLEGAANALALPVKKDMEGRRLILKWCKPRKPTQKNPSLRHTDTSELLRLVEYCKADVAAEVELFLTANPLTPTERRVWELDQKINLRGFLVDRPLVAKILDMIDAETENLNVATMQLTDGAVRSATQRNGTLKWLKEHGAFIPDLRKKTVDDALAANLVRGRCRKLLKYRQAISKTSTAKYEAFDQRSRSDGRVRDILIYHTASTGRWGGAGVQPQNFPRGTIKNSVLAAEICDTGDLELVRMIYGSPMEVFSSCLRSMIIASPGKVLDVADYAAIEVRVLFWLANDKDGVAAFRQGRDLYKELARDIYNQRLLAQITPDQRFLGKTATLGCGYQMGANKFRESCLAQGVTVTEDLAKLAVDAYRKKHKPVVELWRNMEYAALAAVETPGRAYSLGEDYLPRAVRWYCKGDFLWCELPSGRRLAYHRPMVKLEQTAWGEMRPKLYHWGVDSLSKKWVQSSTYGGKLVENVVQAIARDIMANAMLQIEASGKWEIVLSVHDELVAERAEPSDVDNDDFCKLMETVPPWAEGCPVRAEGWDGERYKK